MTLSQLCRLTCAVAALGAALHAQAASFTSSASSAGSASSGSVSDSLTGSSTSSSGDNKVADGNYRIIELAPVAGRADKARITMLADGTQDRIVLSLPQKIVTERGLTAGELVHARNRDYGIEFSSGQRREPFFLVLADAWYDQLANRPVSM